VVKQLLRAKAQIDHSEVGWPCSPLLFAICGYQDSWHIKHQVEALITLIHELLEAGADVNAISKGLDDPEYSEALQEFNLNQHSWPGQGMFSLIYGKDSALTLGATFRYPELVGFLIDHGAHVGFRSNGARSPLRECLYTSQERWMTGRDPPISLMDRLKWLPYHPDSSRVLDTAQRLIVAEVGLNDHHTCDPGNNCRHQDLECYSALDFGLLSQDKNLANTLRSAGAKPTRHSLELAMEVLRDYDTFCQILEADAPLPRWAFTDYEPQAWFTGSQEPLELQKRRATILAALHLGACAPLERLITSHDCSNIFGAFDNDDSDDSDDRDDSDGSDGGYATSTSTALTKAVEECCRRGHLDTLACLLQSDILPQGPRALILGSSLALAIIHGHLEMVDVLLGEGADVNASIEDVPDDPDDPDTPERTVTPLHLAIESGNRELIQKLLHHGAKARSQFAGNLLVAAIQYGDHDIIQLLAEKAPPNEPGLFDLVLAFEEHDFDISESDHGWLCPLAASIIKEEWALMTQLLQGEPFLGSERRSDVPRGERCFTPLWASIFQGNITLARWLINNGAEVNDEAALEYAGAAEDPDLLGLLVEELSTEKRRGQPNALHLALHRAMQHGRLRNARLILDSKIIDLDGFSNHLNLVHHALNSPLVVRKELLRLLLDAGANPDTITAEFIEGASWRGPLTGLLNAIRRRDPGCVEIILDRQAKINGKAASEGGYSAFQLAAYSPLQLAAFEGNSEIVRMLLDRGQDPNVVSFCAEVNEWRNRYRIAHQIGTSVQNATMEKHGGILEMILQHGAKPNSTTMHCQHTALQIACRDGSLKLVELLLEYGADVNAPPAERHGATALQFAAIGGYLGIAHLLLEMGADVNAAPAPFEGRTAFEGAAEHGRVDMVQLLRNAGADIEEAGGQFERALEKANKNGHLAVRALLRSYLS
jgi:ankyrin repeat protein